MFSTLLACLLTWCMHVCVHGYLPTRPYAAYTECRNPYLFCFYWLCRVLVLPTLHCSHTFFVCYTFVCYTFVCYTFVCATTAFGRGKNQNVRRCSFRNCAVCRSRFALKSHTCVACDDVHCFIITFAKLWSHYQPCVWTLPHTHMCTYHACRHISDLSVIKRVNNS